ncbi:hypothetical protein NCS56_01348400 [Fusarium sp. Ph1]|nr:hypothetical protein NCS56_01348400 [Fusarium sp. Ph1]
MSIMEIGAVPFAKIAPPLTVPYFPPTDLHSTLYPKEFDFRLQTIDGKVVIFHISPKEAAYDDSKAENVVIDPNNDAWLIDLAGGWTNGWVDKKVTGTMEGENQALRRVTTYLGFAN